MTKEWKNKLKNIENLLGIITIPVRYLMIPRIMIFLMKLSKKYILESKSKLHRKIFYDLSIKYLFKKLHRPALKSCRNLEHKMLIKKLLRMLIDWSKKGRQKSTNLGNCSEGAENEMIIYEFLTLYLSFEHSWEEYAEWSIFLNFNIFKIIKIYHKCSRNWS